MKKIISLLLLLSMAFSSLFVLSSCTENGNDPSGEEGGNGVNSGTSGSELNREKLEYALSLALDKIDKAIPTFTSKFPAHSSVGNVYSAVENNSGWNTGFWTGILWHAYELTGNSEYRSVALSQIPSYHNRIKNKIGVDHHDWSEPKAIDTK